MGKDSAASGNSSSSGSVSPIKSARTARSIAAVEKLPSPPVQVLHPQWAHWCQQELARGIDGNVVLSELVAQGFEPTRSPLFTQRLLHVAKKRDDRCSNSAESPRTAATKPFSFLQVLEEGILKEVELFVFGGQDVNALLLDANTKLMQSPLHIASKRGYCSIAKLLLERGAQVDHLDSFRRTPLMVAARCGHSELCALMLEHGANIFQLDNLKNSGLHLAAFSGSSTIATLLLHAHDDSFRVFKTNLPQRRGESYERLLQKTYDAIMKSKLRDNERRRVNF
jgi:ankyrin repeat protein